MIKRAQVHGQPLISGRDSLSGRGSGSSVYERLQVFA